ncbi:hypothetical protein MD484_g7884, partial [Candolleomyces efflorescens]
MGTYLSVLSESYPPKAQFRSQDMPDLSGKVAIVTGATAGIGKETAKELLAHNAKVYLGARNREKGEKTIQELKIETGKDGILLELDLSDLKSVAAAAEEFQSYVFEAYSTKTLSEPFVLDRRKETKLHMLFNNAGVMAPPTDQVTAQGYDLQFGTNVLGHFHFTKLLIPTLLNTVKSAPDWKPRIVHTSSVVSSLASPLDFNTLNDGPARRGKAPRWLYKQSKLANIMVSNELARRFGEQGIISASVNPGNIRTELRRFMSPTVETILGYLTLHPVHLGALTQLWAGTSAEGASMNGKYLIPWARYGQPNPVALDEGSNNELWRWLEEQSNYVPGMAWITFSSTHDIYLTEGCKFQRIYPRTVSIVLLLLTFILKRLTSRNKVPLPPGPRGYPIIGNVFDISNERPWISYSKLAKKYGDIVMLEILGTKILILSSYKRAMDLMEGRSSIYSDRPPNTMLLEHMGFDAIFGLLPYGPKWRRQRRIFHQHFDSKVISRYHSAMSSASVSFAKDMLSTPERFADHTRNYFTRIIMKASYGLDVSDDSDDAYIVGIKEVAEGFFEATIPGRFLVDMIPALKYVPSWMPGTSWQRYADHHRKNMNQVKTEPFARVLKATREGREDPTRKEQEDLACDLGVSAYLGGADTSVGTTLTFIMLMAMYPEVQERARAEIDNVVGTGRLPTFEDWPNLPYVDALLRELFRWHQLAPLGLPHATTVNDIYDGYFIPKGTVVIGNLWDMMQNEDVFPHPQVFNPDRHLKDGQINGDLLNPIPPSFGFGRRRCPGRHLALDSIYLVVTTILALFDIVPVKDEAGNSTLKCSFGGKLLMLPEPFECIITPRSDRHAEMIRNLETE